MIISFRNLVAFVVLMLPTNATYAPGSNCTGYMVACGDKYSTTGNGCKEDNNSSNPIQETFEVDASERHAVRCCSDTQPPPEILGTVKQTGCAVWAFSKLTIARAPGIGSNGCHSAENYTEAEAICASNGGRLCTVEEVLNRCTVGSGCNYDNQRVWTKAVAPTLRGSAYSGDLLGCYLDYDTQHLSLKLGSPYSVDGCSQACESAGYPLFGMKNGDTCYCGHANNATSKVEDSECASRCVLGDGNCGGTSAIAVYKTDLSAPSNDFFYENKFRGCVKDTDTHFENKLNGNFSIKMCVTACSGANFALAALAEGGKCWCGDEEPLERSSDCNFPCTNGNGLCGGSAESRAVSMYRTTVAKTTTKNLGLCKGQLANWWGDPHIVTFDNLKYNCQGVGHFTLTECEDYKLQSIFKKSSKSTTSVTHGVAAKYKNYPAVQVIINNITGPLSVPFEMNQCYAELYIGGQLYNSSKASLKQLNTTTGIEISLDLKGFKVSFPQPGPAFNSRIRYSQGCLLDVDTCLHQECIGNTGYPVVGMLGTPNGHNTDDWMYRNGTKYTEGTDPTYYCTSVWCVKNPSESIFTYPSGTSFSTFDMCSNNPPPPPPPANITAPPDVVEKCRAVANDNIDFENCLMDVVFDNNTERAIGGVQTALDHTCTMTPDIRDIPVPPTPKNDCPDDVILYHTDGVTPMADIGTLHLVERSRTDGVVTLQWYNFTGVNPARIYIEYENEGHGYECASTKAITAKPFRVSCPQLRSSAIVHITVSDVDSLKAGDKASLNQCCHGKGDDNPKVKYTFTIPCEDPCNVPAASNTNRLLRRRV